MKPIDEIQLTAYALGEGSAAERAEIEAQLRAAPAAQAAVDGIRALAAQLETELKNEPGIALTDDQRRCFEVLAQCCSAPGAIYNLPTAAGFLDSVDLWPLVTHRFTLDQWEEAIQVMSGGASGKVVMFVGEG